MLSMVFSLTVVICIHIFTQKPLLETLVFTENINRFQARFLSILKPGITEESINEDFDFRKEEIFNADAQKSASATESQASTTSRVIKKETLESDNSSFVSVDEDISETKDEKLNETYQGFLNHHMWENVCNFHVESLREFILYPQTPSKRRFLFSSSTKLNESRNNFGERIFGFIVPPSSGEYQFLISSSWNSELWLSFDEKSENLRRIAYFSSSPENPRRSEKDNVLSFPTQISSTIFLNKDVYYLIDLIHQHQSGKAHLKIAWRFPNATVYTAITSKYLRAKMNDSHVTDDAVRLDDYKEQPKQSHDMIMPYINSKEIQDVLPTCVYQPSYLVKRKLIRFEGARDKSNTHFASVYPPDATNSSLPLLENEDIWWRENAVGNSVTNEDVANSVVSLFMEALEAGFPHVYKLRKIISIQHVPDPNRGDRFLLELMLTDGRTGGDVVFSEYLYKLLENNTLCYPEGFGWNKQVTVNVIVPVKNAGRWALYFIRNIAEIVRQTQDLNVHVIIIDYESNDINIEATLERSSLRSFTVVKMPAKERFQRALALQRGAQTVTDPHSIIFLSDLHLKIPPKLITTIPKHCVEGKMAFAPVVKRLRCGYYPDLPLGYWETLGFGLLAIYKSDFDRVGGMNIKEFTEWGGEDWELLDRILMSGLEVERLKIPDFYHFYHPALGKSHQRIGA